jgi:single-strand DNA-binding protein
MNSVTLLGRTTKEIELKGNDTKYCSFNLAVNRKTKEKETDFISCKAFGKTAEALSQYVQKGQQIAVEGRIQAGSYEKEGTKVYTTDVIVSGFYFTDGKKDKQEGQETIQEVTTEQLQKEGVDELPF